MYSWGKDIEKLGLLGVDSEYYQYTPSVISALEHTKIIDFSLGLNHATAIDDNGKMYTWGYGGQGELGHGDHLTQTDVPTKIECVDHFKITKATATVNSTLFHTEDNIFGMFYCGTKLLLHSIIDYIPSEIFIGLITDSKLMIMTHESQMYMVDAIFGQDGFQHGEYTVVGFQDSLMLFNKLDLSLFDQNKAQQQNEDKEDGEGSR